MRKRAAARGVLCGLIACLMAMVWMASDAAAAPPPNDNRADAQDVTIPATVDGTTVD